MASVVSSTEGARPTWLRVLTGVGTLLLLAIGLPTLALGVILLDEPEGPFLLCAGLVLTAFGVAGIAREVTVRRFRRDPPRARLDRAPSGESALFLPHATGPSVISAWSLAVLGAACLLGAVFGVAAGRWVLGVLLVLAGLGCLLVAQPHRARTLAGGLWFSPSRIWYRHDGVEWEVPWEDVHGAVPRGFTALLVHRGRIPEVRRSAVAGRHRGKAVVDGVLVVDHEHLAGGPSLASYVVEKALADPGFRAALGSPESQPPVGGPPTP